MCNRCGIKVISSSVGGKMLWSKAFLSVQTPPNRSPGAFPPLSQPAQISGILCGVLGGHSLMPVLLHRILLVCRPQIRPELHRLGFGRATADHDPHRFSLDNQCTSGHERSPDEGEGCCARRVHRSCRRGAGCMLKQALYLERRARIGACRSDAGAGLCRVLRTQRFAEDQTGRVLRAAAALPFGVLFLVPPRIECAQ